MHDKILIKHISGQKIFILPHWPVCIKAKMCLCRDGKPHSVHLPHGVTVPVHAAALHSPEVIKALKKKQIEVFAVEKQVEAEPEPSKEPEANEDDGKGKGKKKGSSGKK